MKSRNLKDTFEYSGLAWDKVTQKTIKNCWDHALKGPVEDPALDTSLDDIDDIDGFTSEEVEAAEVYMQETCDRNNKDLRQLMDDWVHAPRGRG